MLDGNFVTLNGRKYYTGNCKDCSGQYRVRTDCKKEHMGYCKSCSYKHRENVPHNKYVKNKNIYKKYIMMKVRCYNKNTDRYNRYGGRGIAVCNEWLNDYSSFEDWSISNGYKDGLTIDRINNDGNYEPSNCRWVTILENSVKDRRILNTEQRKEIRDMLIEGARMTDIANKFNVSVQVIYYIKKTKEVL